MRPVKRRQAKVIDDDEDEEDVQMSTNNKVLDERILNSETAATPKRLHSEVASTRDGHADMDENGSIKSIPHSPQKDKEKQGTPLKNQTLSSLIMPQSID